jgi:DNA-binding MarR family transcriptional regulator
MPFDTLIANAGRLRILTALVAEDRQEFVGLRKRTGLTDGNLSAHAKRLQAAGMIEVEKAFRDGKPVTTLCLTTDGRRRLAAHVDHLVRALRPEPAPDCWAASAPDVGVATPVASDADDDWVD